MDEFIEILIEVGAILAFLLVGGICAFSAFALHC